MYPTKKEFEQLLQTHTLDWLIDTHLFKGQPFYSLNKPDVHQQMIRAISKGLHVPAKDICVVGSARIGFSLSPEKFGSPFNQFSDIDIVVVSSSLFDPSWLDILQSPWKMSHTLSPQTKQSLRDHRKFHYVYNGWIYPGSVIQAIKIGEIWMRTFNGLARIQELAGRSIGGRLYRTWEHARLYHRWSLQQVKDNISN